MMTRMDIINALIQRYDYQSYLEVGVKEGECFNQIKCDYKISVDIEQHGEFPHFHMTSNKFFNNNTKTYDIIFVDGRHEKSQAYLDIINSIKVLNPGGAIVVHDCNPQEEIHQRPHRGSQVWNGDVWQAWVRLRQEDHEMRMAVVDTDHGCGVMMHGKPNLLKTIPRELSWERFVKNRVAWLNLISTFDFLTFYIGYKND